MNFWGWRNHFAMQLLPNCLLSESLLTSYKRQKIILLFPNAMYSILFRTMVNRTQPSANDDYYPENNQPVVRFLAGGF